MAEFHHHPDGIIYLREGGAEYSAPLADFAVDLVACGLPAYAGLPDGFRERRYQSGGFHALYTGDSQTEGGVWPEGETYLSANADLGAAAARRGTR